MTLCAESGTLPGIDMEAASLPRDPLPLAPTPADAQVVSFDRS